MSVFVERKQLLDDRQNNRMLAVRINMGHLSVNNKTILVQHIIFQLLILLPKNAQNKLSLWFNHSLIIYDLTWSLSLRL